MLLARAGRSSARVTPTARRQLPHRLLAHFLKRCRQAAPPCTAGEPAYEPTIPHCCKQPHPSTHPPARPLACLARRHPGRGRCQRGACGRARPLPPPLHPRRCQPPAAAAAAAAAAPTAAAAAPTAAAAGGGSFQPSPAGRRPCQPALQRSPACPLFAARSTWTLPACRRMAAGDRVQREW